MKKVIIAAMLSTVAIAANANDWDTQDAVRDGIKNAYDTIVGDVNYGTTDVAAAYNGLLETLDSNAPTVSAATFTIDPNTWEFTFTDATYTLAGSATPADVEAKVGLLVAAIKTDIVDVTEANIIAILNGPELTQAVADFVMSGDPDDFGAVTNITNLARIEGNKLNTTLSGFRSVATTIHNNIDTYALNATRWNLTTGSLELFTSTDGVAYDTYENYIVGVESTTAVLSAGYLTVPVVDGLTQSRQISTANVNGAEIRKGERSFTIQATWVGGTIGTGGVTYDINGGFMPNDIITEGAPIEQQVTEAYNWVLAG